MGFKLVYFMRKHECARWSGWHTPSPVRACAQTRKHARTHAHPVTVCKDQKQRYDTATATAAAAAFKRDGVRLTQPRRRFAYAVHHCAPRD